MILTPLALAFLPPDSAQHAAWHLFQHGILSDLLGAGRVSKKVKKKCVCVYLRAQVAVWFKFVGFLPKFWLLRLAVRPAGGRGGAPGKLSSGCLLFPARVVVFHFS